MDREEFARRIVDAQGSMYRVACSYLSCEQDRLDAVGEAILKAWQKLYTLRDEQRFSTWLTRILIRECIAIQRRQKRMTPVEEVQPPQPPATQDDELREALSQLPQKLRTAVVLYYMEGYSVAEIARITRTTKGAICSRLSRARIALRAALKEEIE